MNPTSRTFLALATVALACTACSDLPTTGPSALAANATERHSASATSPQAVLYAFLGSRYIARIDVGDWSAQIAATPTNQILDGLALRIDGTLVATHGDPSTFVRELVRIDPSTGIETKTVLTPPLQFTAMVDDPARGLMGITFQNNLYSITETGAATLIGNLNLGDGTGLRTPYIEDVALSSNGTLYGLMRQPGGMGNNPPAALTLVAINVSTATASVVASLGSTELSGIEELGSDLYAVGCASDGPTVYNQVYTVNRVSGALTPVARMRVAGSMDCMRDLAGSGAVVPPVPVDVPQTIQFTSTPPNPALLGDSYHIVATGGGSGNPVTFTSLTESVCTVAGTAASFVSVGECRIAANQAGAAGFLAADQVEQSFTITASPQSIVITSALPNPAVAGNSYTVTAVGGGSGNPVTLSTLTPAVCSVGAGEVTATAAGTCTIAANQAGGIGYFPATQLTASFNVLAIPTSKASCVGSGWAEVVKRDASRFKNQGDCIQYVNTGK